MTTQFQELRAMERKGDYITLIKEVKKLAAQDKRIFTDPYIKEWCGRRWRNLFITEAAGDPQAVKMASKKLAGIKLKDKRDNRQKVAERFMRGDGPLEWQLEMPDAQVKPIKKTSLVFAPGLLTGILPVQAFEDAFPALATGMGIRILRADSHPMRGCTANIADLLRAVEQGIAHDAWGKMIEEQDAVAPGDFFFIGYSKGTPDVLALLVERPDLKNRVRCLINWAGAPGGSHLANNIYNSVKDLPFESMEGRMTDILHMMSPVVKPGPVLARMNEFDIKGATKDLTIPERTAFNTKNNAQIDALNIPIFNITGSTSPLEVPYFQIQGVMELNKYDANNDMQVTQHCAKIHLPMATDLAMLRGHHWDLSYSPFPKAMRFGSPNLEHSFPKGAAANAMTLFVTELGLVN
jgi:hypothetical protein